MKTFVELFLSYRELSPGEQQRRIEREFPALVAQGTLHWWSPGDPVCSSGRRLLIGVATYSSLDMRLLDLVSESVRCRRLDGLMKQQLSLPAGLSAFVQVPKESLHIDVFSVLDCQSHEDFKPYIPSLGKVYQTPVAGLWDNGVLQSWATGAAGRTLVAQVCGLDPQVIASEVVQPGSA